MNSTPRLLDSASLEKSEVVANASMNRQRNLAGPNSYQQDLGLAPLDFLKQRLETQPQAAWLDLCCGTGRALIQAADHCRAAGLDQRVKLTGVDLISMFDPIPPAVHNIHLIAHSLDHWTAAECFDLVTCVHGLHYLGDKLGLLRKASTWLKPDGLLLMHLDYRNLRIDGRSSSAAQIGKDLRRAGFRYVPGRHLLTLNTPTSRHLLPYRYLGADDQAGPNYTGQSAVNSYYQRTNS